jgi:hypothetical protein
MLELATILWLPVVIAIMAVTWVLTLGALGQAPVPVTVEERRIDER